MNISEINDKIALMKVYRYVAELEIEKNKRKNGTFHDFSDGEEFYKKRISEYDAGIIHLSNLKTQKIQSFFAVSTSSIQIVLLVLFFGVIFLKSSF